MMKKYIDDDGNEINPSEIKNYKNFNEINIGSDFIETKKYNDNELISIDYEIENESSISKFDVSLAKNITFFYDKKSQGVFEMKSFKNFVEGNLYSFGQIQSIEGNNVYIKTNFLENVNSTVQKYFYEGRNLRYAFEYDNKGELNAVFDFLSGEYAKDFTCLDHVNFEFYRDFSSFALVRRSK